MTAQILRGRIFFPPKIQKNFFLIKGMKWKYEAVGMGSLIYNVSKVTSLEFKNFLTEKYTSHRKKIEIKVVRQ